MAKNTVLHVAQNHLSPKAYKQNEVVTALNGTTIEIVHTDAEGRMVLLGLPSTAREAASAFLDDVRRVLGESLGRS